MRRLHFIELHEQPWYPAVWRRLFQRGLGRAHKLTRAFENFYAPFSGLLAKLRPVAILDLCSGSGEAAASTWTAIAEHLGSERPVLVLSDLYPDLESYQQISRRHPQVIDYFPDSVNALQVPATAPRVRTLFNSFHHFRPAQAEGILRNAAETSDGIAVFEVTGRTWLNMLQTVFILPFAAAFLTVFLLRPWRPSQLLWGLLLPVIPLTAVFDGIVSNLRTYSVAELRELVANIDAPDFEWEIATVPMPNTGLQATYLLGWNQARASETSR